MITWTSLSKSSSKILQMLTSEDGVQTRLVENVGTNSVADHGSEAARRHNHQSELEDFPNILIWGQS